MATAPSKPQVARGRLRLILLTLCIGFASLLILGLTFLPEIVALERGQRMLISHVEAALQRRVSVGAVRLRLLSSLEVTLEDATLDNPPGWVHSDFLRSGRRAARRGHACVDLRPTRAARSPHHMDQAPGPGVDVEEAPPNPPPAMLLANRASPTRAAYCDPSPAVLPLAPAASRSCP
jgi:hypothetical protein